MAAGISTKSPSTIEPGPEGLNPLSYPLLVQRVLDRLCVSCDGATEPKSGVTLTGEPRQHYTTSYNALVSRVPYSADQARQRRGERIAGPNLQ